MSAGILLSIAGAKDSAGNSQQAYANQAAGFAIDTIAPTATITAVTPNPRSIGVSQMLITFTEAVNGFDLSDLRLTRNGGANLLTASQTLTTSDHIVYTLSNLDRLAAIRGDYELTVVAAGLGIQDNATNLLPANAAAIWQAMLYADTFNTGPLNPAWLVRAGNYTVSNSKMAGTDPTINLATVDRRVGCGRLCSGRRHDCRQQRRGAGRALPERRQLLPRHDRRQLHRNQLRRLSLQIHYGRRLRPTQYHRADIHLLASALCDSKWSARNSSFSMASMLPICPWPPMPMTPHCRTPVSSASVLNVNTTFDNYVADAVILTTPSPLPFVDPFTQSDGTQLSRNWTERQGNFGVLGNALVGKDPTMNLATLNGVALADASMQANVIVAANQGAGLISRYQSNGSFYLGMIAGNSVGTTFTPYLFKYTTATGFVQLNTSTTVLAVGTGTLRFEVIGASLKLLYGADAAHLAQIGFASDNSLTAAGLAGIRTTQNAKLDNFTLDAITPPALPLHRPVHSAQRQHIDRQLDQAAWKFQFRQQCRRGQRRDERGNLRSGVDRRRLRPGQCRAQRQSRRRPDRSLPEQRQLLPRHARGQQHRHQLLRVPLQVRRQHRFHSAQHGHSDGRLRHRHHAVPSRRLNRQAVLRRRCRSSVPNSHGLRHHPDDGRPNRHPRHPERDARQLHARRHHAAAVAFHRFVHPGQRQPTYR